MIAHAKTCIRWDLRKRQLSGRVHPVREGLSRGGDVILCCSDLIGAARCQYCLPEITGGERLGEG